jgi:hypothetical protein
MAATCAALSAQPTVLQTSTPAAAEAEAAAAQQLRLKHHTPHNKTASITYVAAASTRMRRCWLLL